jgi:acetyl-CoA carboxylase biotin carboxylase subunit
MANISKVLIANRGEIALRVMRSLKEMGLKTVAIYSEADRDAPFVQYADEARLIGPPPSSESYLKGQAIIELCKELQVDAIHPGYGFLSENAEFAQMASEAGIIFVGPSAHSIEIMGSKLKAKQTVSDYNIPLVPGTDEAVTDVGAALKAAEEIGFPILIKASAGGGGKGMRIVHEASEFESQMERAVSEAESSFGDGAVFIEKYITTPRHIEIQVLGDQHGNIVHLFERECSIQRRHQKVIEEAPSSVLDETLRAQMGQAAIDVAKSCNYYGAGTVEFMLDENRNFYFLEMNTRLQVEHPVTECITGLDLVKEQIRIAEGKPLSIRQEDLYIQGHALEVRVYAEDPKNNFLPDIGTLKQYRRPQGPGVRVDDGFEQGMEIPIYYDPMISKLIVHASDRETAIRRMVRAIDEYLINGVQTTLSFCKEVLQHPSFTSGNYSTKFIEQYGSELFKEEIPPEVMKVAAILGASLVDNKSQKPKKSSVSEKSSNAWLNRLKDL